MWPVLPEAPGRLPARVAPTRAKTRAATATMARLPSSAWAAERERPSPVLIRATPAMASGASRSRARARAKAASVMAGGVGVMGGFLRALPCGRERRPPGRALRRRARKAQRPPRWGRGEEDECGDREEESGWHHQQSEISHGLSFFRPSHNGRPPRGVRVRIKIGRAEEH